MAFTLEVFGSMVKKLGNMQTEDVSVADVSSSAGELGSGGLYISEIKTWI